MERDSWFSGTFFPSLMIDKSVAFFIVRFLYPCRIPSWLGVTLHLVQAIGCTACSSAGSGHSLWSLQVPGGTCQTSRKKLVLLLTAAPNQEGSVCSARPFLSVPTVATTFYFFAVFSFGFSFAYSGPHPPPLSHLVIELDFHSILKNLKIACFPSEASSKTLTLV